MRLGRLQVSSQGRRGLGYPRTNTEPNILRRKKRRSAQGPAIFGLQRIQMGLVVVDCQLR